MTTALAIHSPQSTTPNPQSPFPNPQSNDWLTIDAAARLIGLSMRHCRRLAVRLAAAPRTAARTLARTAPPPDGRGKPVWWIHRSAHPALARCPGRGTRERLARESLIARYGHHHVKRAYRKAHWLAEWRKRCSRPRAAGRTDAAIAADVVADARNIEGDGFKISVRSLQAWHTAYNRLGAGGTIMGVAALVDGYSGPGPGAVERADQAVDFFYSLYHTQSKDSVRLCHNVTLREAHKQGWSWPAGYTATTRWLRDRDDLSVSHLMRHGKTAWCHRYMPYLEINYSLIDPGSLYVCDHTQVDFWVAYRGRQIRPWLTAIQDCRTRVIVGWHLGPAPHQDAILSALRMAFRDWAIPDNMRIDNGKDFTSKLLTGVTKRERDALRREYGRDWQRVLKRDANLVNCEDSRWLGIVHELGIELIYAIPYSPWSKGTLERWFGTFEDQCGKGFATYCGNSTISRPECLEEIRRGYTRQQKRDLRKRYGREWKKVAALKFVDTSDVPTMDQARAEIGDYIDGEYHRSAHRGLGNDTPLGAWKANATRLRRAVEDQLLFLLDIRGSYKVGPNGVRLTVGSEQLGYGAHCPALARLKGRSVLVAMDQADASQCWALDPKSRTLIARLESNDRIDPLTSVDDVRESIGDMRRAQSAHSKAARSAPQRTRNKGELVRRYKRSLRAELRATGTDDAAAPPTIVPVRTGFETTSKRVQSRVAIAAPDPSDLEDFFDHDPPPVSDEADDDGLDDLFDDAQETVTEEPDGFDDFL